MTPLIRTEQLSYSYPVRGVILYSVDMSLYEGERISL